MWRADRYKHGEPQEPDVPEANLGSGQGKGYAKKGNTVSIHIFGKAAGYFCSVKALQINWHNCVLNIPGPVYYITTSLNQKCFYAL